MHIAVKCVVIRQGNFQVIVPSFLFQKAENENEERKKQEEALRQAEIMMQNQKNKVKTLPSIETAWSYTNDSDVYDDEEDDDDTSSGGSDSS